MARQRIKRNQIPSKYVMGTTKDTDKLLPINHHHLVRVLPKTQNQYDVLNYYDDNFNLVLMGCPGSGKSFLALSMALQSVLDPSTPYEKVVIVRSTVPTRNIGFLPGSEAEKLAVYELPYKSIVIELVVPSITGDIYEKLKAQKTIEFISTSYVRGITLQNCIVVVDEFSNLTMHENDSIITRVGKNCKIIFSGDTRQSDLGNDKLEHTKFLQIINTMKEFKTVVFGVDDIVRSGLVRSYIIAKENLGY